MGTEEITRLLKSLLENSSLRLFRVVSNFIHRVYHPCCQVGCPYWLLENVTEVSGASLVAQLVKNPHAMRETWVRPLSWEDPLEKEMATHSSIAWRIPWAEGLGGLQSTGSRRFGHNWATSLSLSDISSLVHVCVYKLRSRRNDTNIS